MKVFICIFVLGLLSVFAKTDTLVTVNCKCDTIKVLRIVDTTITTKLDTLKVKKPVQVKK